MNTLFKHCLIPALGGFLMASAFASHAKNVMPEVGVVALYQSTQTPQDNKKMITEFEKTLHATGCELHREGAINKAQGKYSLETPSHFITLTCNEASVNSLSNWSWQKYQQVKNIRLLEGDIGMIDTQSIESKGDARLFIIKLSDFNNVSPNKKMADLKKIRTQIKDIEPKFHNEMMFLVDDAFGMNRADEVAVFYYNSPADAKNFRTEHEDIVEEFGAFNMNHLSQFTYLIGKSNR